MNIRNKIVAYSKEKFFNEGFYKISMDEIASGLRVSKKTIYKYFSSKNKLIDAVVMDFQTEIRKELYSIVNTDQNSLLKIKMVSNLFAKISITVNERMLRDLQIQRPDLWQNIDDFRTKIIEEIWTDIIINGKKEGYIKDLPENIIITIIISSISSVINPSFLLNNSYSVKHAFEIMFGILITGVLTEKGKKVYNKIDKENNK